MSAERQLARRLGGVQPEPRLEPLPVLVDQADQGDRDVEQPLGDAGVISALNALGIRRREIPNRDIRKLDEETRAALRGAESFEEIAKRYTSLRPILGSLPTANYLAQLIATVGPLPPLAEIGAPVAVLLSGGTTLARTDVSREEMAEDSGAAR